MVLSVIFMSSETLTADPPSREATARQVTLIKTDQKRYCFWPGLRRITLTCLLSRARERGSDTPKSFTSVRRVTVPGFLVP
jgi:hypothetical protein